MLSKQCNKLYERSLELNLVETAKLARNGEDSPKVLSFLRAFERLISQVHDQKPAALVRLKL